MSIRKIKGLESDFTIVPNYAINDKGLSWAARGMLLYLCSKPEDWDVTISDLVNQTGESSKRSGRDAVRAIMKELIVKGYMRKTQKRVAGKFDNCDHEVCFVPFTENPSTANPSPVEPTQQSKDLTKDRINKKLQALSVDKGVAVNELHKDDFQHCYYMMHVMIKSGHQFYTGKLSMDEWADAENKMIEVDIDHENYIDYWIENHSKTMRKKASLTDLLSDKNGIEFQEYYRIAEQCFDL